MSLYTKIIDLQNLGRAWDKVKKNKPAYGVDNVSYEDFEATRKERLKQLHLELCEHTHEVLPVKLVGLRKGNKLRMVSLYSMADKVVQASIAQELTEIFDKKFSPCTYAYRNNMSAMMAIGKIEKAVLSGKYKYVCKTDITGFFDNINLDKLERLLIDRIKEEDVVELIMAQFHAPSVSQNGELVEKNIGIYQGNSTSPVLSNLYMDHFDKVMEKQDVFFARYADDMILLGKNPENLALAINTVKGLLIDLELEINTDKTYTRGISEGFQFLGYDFSDKGKAIPSKAEENLKLGLEDIWLTMMGTSLEEKLRKGSQILNGWEQYYRDERPIHSIYEYVVVVYMMRHKEELETISKKRVNFNNNYKDIAMYLIEVWKENKWLHLQRLEYEQLYGVEESLVNMEDDICEKEIVSLYEEATKSESIETLECIMQAYADVKLYDHSEKVMEWIQKIKNRESICTIIRYSDVSANSENQEQIDFDEGTLKLFEELFIGREDMHTAEILTEEGKRRSEYVPEPLTREKIRMHLKGTTTLGTYIVRNNETVHYAIIDVDVSRKIIYGDQSGEKLKEHLDKAANLARNIVKTFHDMGLKVYVEFSGYRGYHVWLFFNEWVPLRYVYSLLDIVSSKTNDIPDGLTVEYFPMKNRKKSGSGGQNIKLPYGIHVVFGKRSYFVEEDMSPAGDVNDMLGKIAKYSIENIKKVIGANISDSALSNGKIMQKKVEIDYSKLPEVSESVMVVLKGCNLMQYLVHKSMSTGYLSHLERLSILHVFGHLGDDGKEFVHTVMGYTLNYQYNITQRFIDKMPAKPVSCIKLREQYKQVTAEYGCSCMFKRTKDCYPSPVIHALKLNTEERHDITIPTSRTISKASEETVYDDLNIHVKVQGLASKIVELKKQKRGIDKSIMKVEKDLCRIFDNNKVDCMEVDMGILIRKKTDEGYDWVIEI